MGRLNDGVQVWRHLVGILLIHVYQFSIAHDHRQCIIELVGNTSGQIGDGFEFAGFFELRLNFFSFLIFGPQLHIGPAEGLCLLGNLIVQGLLELEVF